MSKTKIARRYATSLFDLALETEHLERVRNDLVALRSLIKESPEFAHFLEDPLLTTERRSTILKALFHNQLEPTVFQFILFLEDKHRIHLLELICILYEELYDDYKGILKVHIITARELASDQLKIITEKLKKRFKKDIVADVRLDTSLLGGFRIIIGDRVLDYSLVAQLLRIQQNIVNA